MNACIYQFLYAAGYLALCLYDIKDTHKDNHKNNY